MVIARAHGHFSGIIRPLCIVILAAGPSKHDICLDYCSRGNLSGTTSVEFVCKLTIYHNQKHLSSNIQPEPDILILLVHVDDPAVSLEAFGQGVSLLESTLIGESDGKSPGSPRPFIFAQLEHEKRSHLISRFFDPQQSTSTCKSVWIMYTEGLYPRWKLLGVERVNIEMPIEAYQELP